MTQGCLAPETQRQRQRQLQKRRHCSTDSSTWHGIDETGWDSKYKIYFAHLDFVIGNVHVNQLG